MPVYDRAYYIYYLDQKNKVKLSEARKIEIGDGFVAVYGVSDESMPKRIIPMDRVVEIYRLYDQEVAGAGDRTT